MSSRFALSSLLVLGLLAGCGLSPQTSAPQAQRVQASAAYNGCYLALTFTPSPTIAGEASRIRQQLKFLDLSNAIPKRDTDEMHVTVGYFKKLLPHQAQRIAELFKNKDAYLYVEGYGVANNQVAYFTVSGVDEARTALKQQGIVFEGDDPHITFGVSPTNPRDVHGVSKKAIHPVGPHKLLAQYHFKQGSNNLW
ncbi:hypothetical protein J7643_03330 [bacterium]|nr:hypothetical protein [bacterium]